MQKTLARAAHKLFAIALLATFAYFATAPEARSQHGDKTKRHLSVMHCIDQKTAHAKIAEVGETLQGAGTTVDMSTALEFWHNAKTRTWTITMLTQDGDRCLVAYGPKWFPTK